MFAQKFAGMVKRCADCGFDLAGGLVEVVPTAHYFMGGVVVDTDTRTGLDGLYVAGEDAGGAHGANRLGRQWRCQLHCLWRHCRRCDGA